MPKDTMPRWMEEFWSKNPTEYTKDDISHLEPGSETAVFLKSLALKGGDAQRKKFLAKGTMPRWIEQFLSKSPTEYTKDDISHLEPSSETAVFLKLLALSSCKTETLSLLTQNGEKFMTSDGLIFCTNKQIEVKE